MLGSNLNKCLESAGETTKENGEIVHKFSSEAKNSLVLIDNLLI
jgi:hypothetical protein